MHNTNSLQPWWCFFTTKKKAVQAEKELLSYGIQNLACIEEPLFVKWVGQADPQHFPSEWKNISHLEPYPAEINWEEQWELFCPYYQKGICSIPLGDFSSQNSAILQLLPGPGFGDLSHPTTYSMLEELSHKAKGAHVLDVGCGSGILALAALLWGAKSAHGVDIDPLAIEHTKKNATHNHLSISLSEKIPPNLPCTLICLNMTLEEQKTVIPSVASYKGALILSSGIVAKQRKSYEKFLQMYDLHIYKTIEKKPWLTFHIQ